MISNVEKLLTFFITLFMGTITAVAIYKGITNEECLQRGYKEGKISIALKQYCVKRVNQTDVVRPLEDLK